MLDNITAPISAFGTRVAEKLAGRISETVQSAPAAIHAGLATSGYFGNPIGLAVIAIDPAGAVDAVRAQGEGAVLGPVEQGKRFAEAGGELAYSIGHSSEEGQGAKAVEASAELAAIAIETTASIVIGKFLGGGGGSAAAEARSGSAGAARQFPKRSGLRAGTFGGSSGKGGGRPSSRRLRTEEARLRRSSRS